MQQRQGCALVEQGVVTLIPLNTADGYSPLGVKNLHPKWVAKLGQSGLHCFRPSSNGCEGARRIAQSEHDMLGTLLPHVVRHPLLRVDLDAALKAYQQEYLGAMYSGCGGGYLIVVSETPVPGAFKVSVRVSGK